MTNPTPRKQPYKFVPFQYPIETKENLKRPKSFPDKDFLETLFNRRSQREFSSLSKEELSYLLYICTKTEYLQSDVTGFIHSKRTAPSAGARHPVDLLISTNKSNSKRELSYYNPIDHSIGKLIIEPDKLESFFKEVAENLAIENACIIWFAIQTEKTASKYINPKTLYWKDTGALLYCIQLVAQYLNLKSCPLGTLANKSFPKLFKSSQIVSGGGILIGK